MGIPNVYLSTLGASKDVPRRAPSGARVAVHYPWLGRSIELQATPLGTWGVSQIPAPGCQGDYLQVVHGDLRTTHRALPHDVTAFLQAVAEFERYRDPRALNLRKRARALLQP